MSRVCGIENEAAEPAVGSRETLDTPHFARRESGETGRRAEVAS